MKRKILLIHNGYPLGEEVGDKVRVLNMVQSLRNIGLEVFFLAFYKKGFSALRKERANAPMGIKCLFLYTLPDRFGLTNIAELYRALYTWWIVKKYGIELVQIETSLSASCIRFVNRNIPVFTDFHADPVPELEMNGHSRKYIRKTIGDIRYILKRSQKVIAVSNNLLMNLREYYPYEGKTTVLPCSFNEQIFQEVDICASQELRKDLGLEERIVLCYLGGTHRWQCIEETLDLFIRLRELDSRYFLCIYTNGDLSPFTDRLNLLRDNFLCKGLPYKNVPLFLSIVDVGFVLRQKSLVNMNASPTKTAEYLASGAMVVATKYSGDAPVLIQESGCGFLLDGVQPSENELMALHKRILSYVASRELYASMARAYAFNERVWISNEKKLAELYKEYSL
ncbi:glycosyltransferase [Parabacteroides distasonis]|uniref:glycosyltransferase n=1 Tax=Parabacteroides distasonis TaxID=823 RepID=UPI0039B4F4CD